MPYCAQPNELCFLTLQFLSPSVFFSFWLYIGHLVIYWPFLLHQFKTERKGFTICTHFIILFSSLQMNKKNPKPTENQQKPKQSTSKIKTNKTPNKTYQQQRKNQTNPPNQKKPPQSPALPFSLSSFVPGHYNGSH